MKDRLSEKWIKASIAGTIWAASEIVLGSFLHNLKIPFSGNILTAIGIIILISLSYLWTEKGLFWRAGLICAVMKTMSPSAVIFGPMIAIFAESLLLELFVRMLGRTMAGYITGAIFAMSWNLFQKIANYIIFYGSGIVEVYTNLLKMAQKQLDIKTDIVWLPIILLLIVYALFGVVAAIIGIRTGRKLLQQPAAINSAEASGPVNGDTPGKEISFNYSVWWVALSIFFIVASLILLNKTSILVWSASITAIIVIWSIRYKRALRQLAKPKFWIFFVFISLVTAIVFANVKQGESMFMTGLLTGIQMNFRAVVIIVGFSALGTELYNPVIRNFFLRSSFKNLPLALELSAESLPSFIAAIPDFKSLIKNPVSIFYQVISRADSRLAEIKNNAIHTRKVLIITGQAGGGKTTCVRKLADLLKENNIPTGGILSEKVRSDSGVIGYNLINIETGESENFLRLDEERGTEKIGRYTICPAGLKMGNDILSTMLCVVGKLVIIDEVGRLELDDRGWSDSVSDLLQNRGNNILMTVRDTFMEDIIKKWDLEEAVIFNITESAQNDIEVSVLDYIKPHN
jgi:nucleoside-triphosphatase THEP1